MTATKRCAYLFRCDKRSYIAPNVATLQQYGASKSHIRYILFKQPKTLLTSPYKFKNLAEEVKQMGISPLTINFVSAISIKCALHKSTLEKKKNAFKHWGLSEKEILSTFVKFPKIFALSTENIMGTMDFLINEMGWGGSLWVLQHPVVLAMGLKNRIIPRSSVIRVLLSKGLIVEALSIYAVFYTSEDRFLQKFVTCYEDEAPNLLKVYQETLDHS